MTFQSEIWSQQKSEKKKIYLHFPLQATSRRELERKEKKPHVVIRRRTKGREREEKKKKNEGMEKRMKEKWKKIKQKHQVLKASMLTRNALISPTFLVNKLCMYTTLNSNLC